MKILEIESCLYCKYLKYPSLNNNIGLNGCEKENRKMTIDETEKINFGIFPAWCPLSEQSENYKNSKEIKND